MSEKKKILLIEDDAFIRDIYGQKITEEGYDVEMAENGLQAIKKFDSAQKPDLILLDIMMPYMDGMDVLKKIREHETWKNIPVIMLTNLSESEKINFALEEGINEYLIKSHFTPTEVMSKINTLLNEKNLV